MASSYTLNYNARFPQRLLLTNSSKRLFFFCVYFFICDQMLLPMFHVGGIPFKLSYFILAGSLLFFLTAKSQENDHTLSIMRYDFFCFGGYFLLLIVISIIGEIYFVVSYPVENYAEFYRSLLTYLLIILSFGYGQYSFNLNIKALLYFFYASAIISLSFTFLAVQFPWLGHLYYHNSDYLQKILLYNRSVGLFGNPNVSMLMVNILLMMLLVSYKKGYVTFNNMIHFPLIILCSCLLTVTFVSKNQVFVSFILIFYHINTLLRGKKLSQKLNYFLGALILIVVMVFVLSRFHHGDALKLLFSRFHQIQFNVGKINSENRAQSILRPLFTFHLFWARFSQSPIFGFGFDPTPYGILHYSARYYHNDIFKILATSGVIGFAIMMRCIFKFCYALSPILLSEFIFSGLTNTFIEVIPAIVFFFFMVGVLWAREKVNRSNNAK